MLLTSLTSEPLAFLAALASAVLSASFSAPVSTGCDCSNLSSGITLFFPNFSELARASSCAAYARLSYPQVVRLAPIDWSFLPRSRCTQHYVPATRVALLVCLCFEFCFMQSVFQLSKKLQDPLSARFVQAANGVFVRLRKLLHDSIFMHDVISVRRMRFDAESMSELVGSGRLESFHRAVHA